MKQKLKKKSVRHVGSGGYRLKSLNSQHEQLTACWKKKTNQNQLSNPIQLNPIVEIGLQVDSTQLAPYYQ